MDKITRAKYYAEIAHSGQVYADEVPYTVHLQNVVDVLHRFAIEDEDLYVAAWLHDSIEDTKVTYNDIKERFGQQVAECVYAVTNERGRNRKERNAKTYPKIRGNHAATILKLADRIANVEYGAASGGKVSMYRAEFQDFKQALWTEDQTASGDISRMWTHLTALLS